MPRHAVRGCWLLLLALATGCTSGSSTGPAKEESALKGMFGTFQTALEKGDADSIWAFLDADTQAAADRAAKRLRSDAEKLAPDERDKKAKELGLSGDELTDLTGKGYLKTLRFREKVHEIPGSKVLGATIQGDKGIVKYKEEDGDEETLHFTKDAYGVWKVSLAIE
jgi:hypothetical protein